MDVGHIRRLWRNHSVVSDKERELPWIAHLSPKRVSGIAHKVDVVSNGRVEGRRVPAALLVSHPKTRVRNSFGQVEAFIP